MTGVVAIALAGLICIPILTGIIWFWESIFPPREVPPSCKLCDPEQYSSYEGAPCSTCLEQDRELQRANR